MKNDILVVDDEKDIRHLISGILQDEGYETRLAWSLESVKLELVKRIPSLILLDVWLEKSSADGIDILKIIKKSYSDIPVIMISGHGTIDMAINAIRIGAYDFIEKPFDTNILIMSINRVLDIAKIKKQNKELAAKFIFSKDYLGISQSAINIRSTVEKASPTESRVFLKGATGSGKNHLARLIHHKSLRKNGPLVIANTKRVTPEMLESYLFGIENNEGVVTKIGVIEQAHRGTLYIDEICNLNKSLQARLVKLLTEKTINRVTGKYNIDIDIRIVVGTSFNIQDEISKNNFREDLFYRLNVVSIEIPSLNDRVDDIPDFVDYFIKICCENIGVTPLKMSKEGYSYLQSRKWNGNLRELKNVIEKILILNQKNDNGEISLDFIDTDQDKNYSSFEELVQKKMLSLSLKKAREYFEREYIKIQMIRFNNNVSQTADFIGMERSALHRKLKNLNLNK